MIAKDLSPCLLLRQIVVTSWASRSISGPAVMKALDRFVCGDWGDITPATAAQNDQALRESGSLLAAYHAPDGEEFWIITEADQSIATVLLPQEY